MQIRILLARVLLGATWIAGQASGATAARANYLDTSAGAAEIRGAEASGTQALHPLGGIAATIVEAPTAVAETIGGAAAFRVVAQSDLPLTYQWFRDGMALPGETQATIMRSPLTASDVGTFAVTVTNAAGTVQSEAVSLTLLPRPTAILDETFRADAALDGRVQVLLPLPDGGVLVALAQGIDGVRLRKLTSDGTLDPRWADSTFKMTVAYAPSVATVLVQSDGRIFVGGHFDTHNGVPRRNLVRLHPDGTLDPTFMPAPEAVASAVLELVLQEHGQVVVATGGITPIRLLADGQLDSTFRPVKQPDVAVPRLPLTSPESRERHIEHVATAPEGKIYAAGTAYLSFIPIQDRVVNTRIERLLANGSVDPTFTPVQLIGLFAMRVLDDATLLAVEQIPAPYGGFDNGPGSVRRFQADGTEFSDYAQPVIPYPAAIYLYPDGRVLAAALKEGPVLLNALGAVEPGFTGGVADVTALAVTATGQVLAGGSFTLYNGQPASRVARLNAVPNESVNAPRILNFAANKSTVRAGESVTLTAAVSGSADLTYDWSGMNMDGSARRTNTSSLEFAFTQPGSRSMQLTVQNPRGAATSERLSIEVLPAVPTITGQPSTLSVEQGRDVLLKLSINTEAGNCTFDWYRNGERLGSSGSGPSWLLPGVTSANAGIYTAVVRNLSGETVTSAPMVLKTAPGSRLDNLSTRASVGAEGGPIIAGFVITGSRPRTLLVRGIGRGLTRFGVADALPDPSFELFDHDGFSYYSSDNWSSGTLTSAFVRLGAFPLADGSKDDAALITVGPGTYTIHLTGQPGQTGTALIEIYEADNDSDRILNLSTRAFASAQAPAIAGFVIRGTAPKRVLIRAAGPSLATFDVANPHPNPQLELRNAQGIAVAANDDWAGHAVAEAASSVGAFPFPSGSRDAALVVTLEPGLYSAVVTSGTDGSGVVLAEIYELP